MGIKHQPGQCNDLPETFRADPRRDQLSDAPFHETHFPKENVERAIPDLFQLKASQHAGSLSVKSPSHQLTYLMLNRDSDCVAGAILDHLGPGSEPVGLLFNHDVSAVAALLGVLKAGKMFVPLDPTFPEERLTFLVNDANVRLIVTNGRNLSLAHTLAGQNRQVLDSDQLPAILFDRGPDMSDKPDTPCAILYTSGSTAQPKGVLHSHRSLLYDVWLYTTANCITSDDRLALIFHYSYSASITEILSSLLNGASLLILNPREAGYQRLAQWLKSERISILKAPVSLFRQFTDSLAPECFFPSLRCVTTGGDTVYAADVMRFRRHVSANCVVVNRLASTETKLISTFPVGPKTPVKGDLLPAGYPAEGKEVLILDHDGRKMGTGEVGEIVVKSRYLAVGYWQRPDLTRQAFTPAPRGEQEYLFRTGDLGRRQPDGCLERLGRKDSQVKIRGYRVEIAEVESALRRLDNIRAAAVVAIDGKAGERRLVAYVVPRRRPGPTASTMRNALVQRIPHFMLPYSFVLLDAMPLTPTGKIDRLALPGLDNKRPKLESPYCPPCDAIEEQLVEIWQTVLDIYPVGIEDNFFDLGGDSLSAMQLYARIDAVFETELPTTSILQAPTITQMARLLAQMPRLPPWTSLALLQSGREVRPPLFLAHGIGGGVTDYAYLARRLGPDQTVYGLQARGITDKQQPDMTIEAMAAHYVEELRLVHPQGPYFIAGYSFGGVVAFEMGQQLLEQGEPVAFLGILDCTAPNFTLKAHGLDYQSISSFLGNLPSWMVDFGRLGLRGMGVRFRRKTRWTAKRVLDRLNRGQAKPLLPALHDRFDDLTQVPVERLRLMKILAAAKDAYIPRPYQGRITLFRGRVQTLAASFDTKGGWDRLAENGVDVHIVAGNHHNMHLEPQVASLAAQMRVCLDQIFHHGDR